MATAKATAKSTPFRKSVNQSIHPSICPSTYVCEEEAARDALCTFSTPTEKISMSVRDDQPSSSISSSFPTSMAVMARPSISLPPRVGFGLGGSDAASPGPMTLAPRLFPEDPHCGSFSQLLAMVDEDDDAPERKAARMQQQTTSAEAFLTSIATFSLLQHSSSPQPLFASVSGAFAVAQQQNKEHVTDQTGWLHSQIHTQPEYSCASTAMTTTSIHSVTSSGSMAASKHMQIHSLDPKTSESGFSECLNSEQRSNSASYYVDKPCDDGYNWRKYGQKHVKGSEYPRSYYKCTYRDCLVKKMVERSLDGQITEIIYKGQHNHERPSSTRRGKDTDIFQQESNRLFDVIDKASQYGNGKVITSDGTYDPLHGRDEEADQSNLGCSDDEYRVDAQIRTDYWGNHEPDQKRSRIAETGVIRPVLSQRTVAEPKVVVQTRSEVDLLDDGYRWRKYGQKVVKGSSHPRSYYKCTYAGCNVRKHIERASTDPRSVVTTYEGKHNHDVPTTRNSNHNMATTGATNILQPKAVHAASGKSLLGRMEYESTNQQPSTGALRMKEE